MNHHASKTTRRTRFAAQAIAAAGSLLLVASAQAASQEPDRAEPRQKITVQAGQAAPVTPFVFDGDVRDLPPAPVWKPGDPIKEIPRRYYPRPGGFEEPDYEPGIDPLLEIQHNAPVQRGSGSFTTPTRNFAGQGFTGVSPPDTVGDVGPNYYIQMVNSGGGADVAIYDKSEPTPGLVTTFALDMLGSGACASGFGDPVVLYDRLAGRWMLSEFSSAGNDLCVYISQTGDPVTGGWFAYNFVPDSFPDYPKYGVWPTDANDGPGSYVVTANDGGSARGIYAMERGPMLNGAAAGFQFVDIPTLPGFSFQTATPADLDGPTPPPSTAPAIIMRHRDTENHSGPAAPGDLLEMWTFDIDWVTPANSALTTETSIDIAEIDSDLCGLTAFFCFPQPGSGTTLDPLREVIMFRLQYMNHGDHETLVGNMVTDVDGTDHGGLRWFELRGGDGAWVLHQEGTYSIDSDSRWMAASAMDQSGNIAIAYNVSSTSTFPSLRYTGRLSDDPAGMMTQPETSIHAGTAASGTNRYGDYSAMNLDPVDDCTFWFTGQDNDSSSWRTQIASFKFDACGCLLAPSPLTASAANTGDNEIAIDWNDADLPSVVEYDVRRSRTPGGPYETIATIADSSPGVAGGAGYVYGDTDVSGGITYYYIVRASDGVACRSDDSNEVNETATGVCTLPPVFDGLQSVSTPFFATCTLDLAWNPAAAECGGPIEYNVYRSTMQSFTPDGTTLLTGGLSGTTFSDIDVLNDSETYYYVVRAVDTAVAIEEANLVKKSGVPQGQLTPGTWSDDAGDTGAAKMILDGPWSVDPAEGNIGPAVYKTGVYGDLACTAITTPVLQLGAGSAITFSSRYDIENSYDKGEVQISTDGLSWQRVAVNYPGTSTHASDNCGLPTGDYFTGVDVTWQVYSGDLSAWGGQAVQIRWVLSSDGSVTGDGWWVDDISITNADIPAVCASGSACEQNPFVAVTPDGPMTVCQDEPQLLTAGLTGGTGPFLYQWTRDGVDVPGGSGPTFLADELGVHDYNCRVRSESCPDTVSDGVDTRIVWRGTPFFDGAGSVTNAGLDSCTLDLSWDPASSVCPGPISYSIYRDTTSPVDLTPDNLIASGLSATSYSDAEGLTSGVTYLFVVLAEDESTGQVELNNVEVAATPSGPGGGLQTVFFDDFEDPLNFADWTASTGPGAHTCGDWLRVDQETQRPTGSTGFYALVDSDACGSESLTSAILDSPVIDVNIPNVQTVTLEYDVFYRALDDNSTVEVWDGAAWQVVWSDPDANVTGHQVLDVTAFAAGNPNFQVRFSYQDADWDWWFAVDNVRVTAEVNNPCSPASTGGPTPSPAPDGIAGTGPLLAERITSNGGTIAVDWDATSCASTDYNLIYGDLGGVATYTLGGGECALGTSGSFNWSPVPAGDLYFLIVGKDGVATESSWGRDGGSNERNGSLASGQCGATLKDNTQTCP